MVLHERENVTFVELVVLSELAILPACQACRSTNPKRTVMRSEQTKNPVGRQRLARWRLPLNVFDSIEAKQAKFCSQPEITVWCLSNCVELAFDKSVTDLPRRVRIL